VYERNKGRVVFENGCPKEIEAKPPFNAGFKYRNGPQNSDQLVS
jgi:hypothetical protein